MYTPLIAVAIILAMTALTGQCHYRQLSVEYAVIYCFSLSILFVAALYLLVPPKVRLLDRNDALHIQWRMFAVATVCVTATILYPFIFCQTVEENNTGRSTVSALKLMGWSLAPHAVIGVLIHTCLLYTGPITASLFYVRWNCHRMRAGGRNISYIQTFYLLYIEPITLPFLEGDSCQQWTRIRNLLVAPLSEEVVFRGCMVSPLLASGLRPTFTCFVAPLFFGTAHFHHALLKYKLGMPMSSVVVMTAFQFTYTSLFGAYTTYAFLRTGSILAITLSHSFCNLFGFPDLTFLKSNGAPLSGLYPYRWLLVGAYLVGIGAFVWGFQSSFILPPSPGRLVELVDQSVME